jgi:chaperonin GroEL (HSP60 family)
VQTYKTFSDGEMIMSVFEFQANPQNGRIEIPAEYQDKIVGTVHVIVLSQETLVNGADMIDRLLAHPLVIESFAPLVREEIYERR